MPRLFVSINLPEKVKSQLADISYGLPGANWVDPEQMHLTLRFVGEVDMDAYHTIRRALSSVQADVFALSLKGMGHFPLRGAPKTLWAGVEKNEALWQLRNKVERLLLRSGLEPDARKFFPHVTLAKLRDVPDDVMGKFLSHYALFRTSTIPVQDFSLYSSTLTSERAIHKLERQYPLQGFLGEDE